MWENWDRSEFGFHASGDVHLNSLIFGMTEIQQNFPEQYGRNHVIQICFLSFLRSLNGAKAIVN